MTYSARSAIVAGRGTGRAIEASNKGLAALSTTMKVNSVTEVTQIIAQKFGNEGKEMMDAFLAAVKAAE